MDTSKSAKPMFYFSIILVTALIGFLIYSINEEKMQNDFISDFPSSSDLLSSSPVFSYEGVYENIATGNIISIAKLNESSAVIVRKDLQIEVTFCNTSDNQITMEDGTNVIIDNQVLTIGNDHENALAGEYNKTGEYTVNNYYNDTFGNSEFLSSSWNGIYKINSITIKIYQLDIDKYIFNYSNSNNGKEFQKIMNLQSNTLSVYDGAGNIIVSPLASAIKIVANPENGDDTYSGINGTFIRESSYLFEDIIADLNN